MCLYPYKAYLLEFIDSNGELCRSIRFVKNNDADLGYNWTPLDLPCGKCLECLQQYSKEWSFRIMLEASLYEKNCFITLTYKNSPNFLVKKDLQDFLKRLRRRLEPLRIRFFACGEYGKKGKRPHFHLIVFGWEPSDLVPFFRDKKGNQIYLSDFVSSVWSKGFITVGSLSLESAKYCAKYLQKMQKNYTFFKVKPFVLMSLKPGIGLKAFQLKEDIFLKSDKIYFNGKSCKIPRYFLNKSLDFNKVSLIKENRIFKAQLLKPSDEMLKIRRLRANFLLK